MKNRSLAVAAELARIDIEIEDLRERAQRGSIDMFTFQKLSETLQERKDILRKSEEERKRIENAVSSQLVQATGIGGGIGISGIAPQAHQTFQQVYQKQVTPRGGGWIKQTRKKSKFISDLKKAGDNQKKIKEMFTILMQTDRLRVISLDKDHKRGLQVLEVEDKFDRDIYTVEVSERMSVSSDMFSSEHRWTYTKIQEEIQVTGLRRDPTSSGGHYNQYYQSSTGDDSNAFYASSIGKLAANLYAGYERMLTEDQRRTLKLIVESTPQGILPSSEDIFF